MNNKYLRFCLFLITAIVSCWATASSFHLMMPSWPIIAVYAITFVFFLAASAAVKMIWDAINNDGTLTHPKLQLWGGMVMLLVTWIIISFPTNAHTFFYLTRIGDVVTDDLKTTKEYSRQIKERSVTDSAFYQLEKEVMSEWSKYEDEVITGTGTHGSGIGQYANRHVSAINEMLGSQYAIPTPPQTNGATQAYLAQHLNKWKDNYLKPTMAKIKHDRYQVSDNAAMEASKDVAYIEAMEDTIHQLILTNRISSSESEPVIKQAEGVLVVAYTNIKSNDRYVNFLTEKDRELYTAAHIETKTTRFLNPYVVLWDFFTGKISFFFIFWLILSLAIDALGFLLFELAMKKEYDF